MTRTLITVALLLAFGTALYFGTRKVADTASEELTAILAPKFEEAGAHFESLEVQPASGTVVLHEVTVDDAEASIGLISVQSRLEDLMALMEGTPDQLHGLTVHIEDARIIADGESVDIKEADCRLDALIDVRALQQDPEAYLEQLMLQDEVEFELSGRHWSIQSPSLAREWSLPSSFLKLDAVDVDLDKDWNKISAAMAVESPDLGDISLSMAGDDRHLDRLDLELANMAFDPEEDVRIRIGSSSISMEGHIPYEQMDDDGLEDLARLGTAMEWTVRMRDCAISTSNQRKYDVPFSQLTLASLDHNLKYTGQRLNTTLRFSSNMGAGDMDIDLDIRSLDPPLIDARTMELSIGDLPTEIERELEGLPFLTRVGDRYTFSYRGPLSDLLEAAL